MSVTRVHVKPEEWYPVLLLEPSDPTMPEFDMEVPDELLSRYRDTLRDFVAVQAELRKLQGLDKLDSPYGPFPKPDEVKV